MTRPSAGPSAPRPAPATVALVAAALASAAILLAGLPPGYPHNDAAAYHRMVELWVARGHPVLVGWNETVLLGHLAVGVVAARLGLGGTAARQVLVALQAVVLVALLAQLGARRRPAPWAVACALVWLLYPASMFAATSFMTEVPAALAFTAALLSTLAWLERPRRRWLLVASLAAAWALSIRQQAAVLPLALLLGIPAARGRSRVGLTLLAAVSTLAGAGIWLYRARLPLAVVRPLRSALLAPTPASGVVLSRHLAEAAVTLGLALLPLAAAAILSSRRALAAAVAGAAAGAVAAAVGWSFPYWPNVVTRRGLLPDLLPPPASPPVVLSRAACGALTTLGWAAAAALLSVVPWGRLLRRPDDRILALAVAGQLAAVAVAAAPFDRWLVPVLPIAALAVVRWTEVRPWAGALAALVTLALLATTAVGVARTHRRQRDVWTIAERLVREGIPADRLDGGFEWNLAHQPLPFHPEEARPVPPGVPWYRGYPFTRLEPVAMLWTGAAPPPGWTASFRRSIRCGPDVLVLVRDPDLARRLRYTADDHRRPDTGRRTME